MSDIEQFSRIKQEIEAFQNKFQGTGYVFIKNLDKTIDDLSIFRIFAEFGTVSFCEVAKNKNGMSKGYGVVHFETDEAANTAIEKVNGLIVAGKKIFVGRFILRQEPEKVLESTEVVENAFKALNVNLDLKRIRIRHLERMVLLERIANAELKVQHQALGETIDIIKNTDRCLHQVYMAMGGLDSVSKITVSSAAQLSFMRSSNEPDENMTQLKKQLVEIKKKSALHSLQLETYEKTLKDVTDSHETKDQEVKVNLETNENKESEIQLEETSLVPSEQSFIVQVQSKAASMTHETEKNDMINGMETKSLAKKRGFDDNSYDVDGNALKTNEAAPKWKSFAEREDKVKQIVFCRRIEKQNTDTAQRFSVTSQPAIKCKESDDEITIDKVSPAKKPYYGELLQEDNHHMDHIQRNAYSYGNCPWPMAAPSAPTVLVANPNYQSASNSVLRIITHSTASQNYGEDCQTVATVANNTYSPGYDNKMAASSNSSHGGHYFVISRKAAHVGDVASEQFNQGENKTLAVQHDGNNGSLSYGSSLHVDSELAFETPKTPVQLVVVQTTHTPPLTSDVPSKIFGNICDNGNFESNDRLMKQNDGIESMESYSEDNEHSFGDLSRNIDSSESGDLVRSNISDSFIEMMNSDEYSFNGDSISEQLQSDQTYIQLDDDVLDLSFNEVDDFGDFE